MAQKLPPEVEQLIIKYQQLESQLASVLTQKSVVLSQIREIERTLNILQSLGDDAIVYRNTGFVLVKVDKGTIVKELEEKKEELQIRLSSLERMESLLRKQLDDVKNQLSKYRTTVTAGGSAGG